MTNSMIPTYTMAQPQNVNYQPQYYQPIPNQYASMNYVPQPQQLPPSPQPMPQMRTNLPGRFINSIDEVKPGEIPMDGSMGLFPKADASCIYIKSWKSDGTINTVKYVPAVEAEAAVIQETTSPLTQEILDKLAAIERSLAYAKRQTKKDGEQK